MSVLQPRTIRGQLTAGLVLLECVFLGLFAAMLIREQQTDVRNRAQRRLQTQAKTLSVEAVEALDSNHPEWLNKELGASIASRAIQALRVTDANGKVIAQASKSNQPILWHLDRVHLAQVGDQVMVLPYEVTGDMGEGIVRLSDNGRLLGYAWIMEDPTSDRLEMQALLRGALFIGVLNLLGCILLSALLARSITRPLAVLTRATRRLIRNPESQDGFPLHITEKNEAADLARAFNLLVSSIAEQRAGLTDTLSLLDAMLANAPVGFAFFDRDHRCVRVNRYLAAVSAMPVHDYLGKSVYELMSGHAAANLARYIDAVFATGNASHDQDFREREVRTGMDHAPDDSRSWFLNVYPVRSGSDAVRWAGAVFVDVSERKRAEDALRKAEKLAAAGRLAASIAHEINNPLESVTNLLYLLEKHPSLDSEARNFAYVAQQEVARVSEMAQRTLRFYRQSTLPVDANVADILDSVLAVYQGRFTALGTQVDTRFHRDAQLFCFAGELRQVFANLIGNALDASAEGGKLVLCVRRSHCRLSGRPGVRITVADTGSGMPDSVRRRIFEPFFTTKDATGTGLGLWITTEILEKHGATIFVRSRQAADAPPGSGRQSGTVFMLFFPEQGVARVTARPVADAVTV